MILIISPINRRRSIIPNTLNKSAAMAPKLLNRRRRIIPNTLNKSAAMVPKLLNILFIIFLVVVFLLCQCQCSGTNGNKTGSGTKGNETGSGTKGTKPNLIWKFIFENMVITNARNSFLLMKT